MDPSSEPSKLATKLGYFTLRVFGIFSMLDVRSVREGICHRLSTRLHVQFAREMAAMEC